MKKILYILLLLFPVFIFAQSESLTSPNGGEIIDGCSNYTITWDENLTTLYFNVDYSSDGGQTWLCRDRKFFNFST